MKFPKEPQKPYKPFKPMEPSKKTSGNIVIKSISIDTYSPYNIEDLFGAGIEQQNNSYIVFETEKEWDYDDYTTSILAKLLSSKEIDDPNYEKNLSAYKKALAKYEKDCEKFKELNKQYKLDYAKFQFELDQYNLEKKKEQVKTLEEKLARLKEDL